MGRTLDFQEDAGLDAFKRAQARNLDRVVRAEPFELNLLLHPIAGHIGIDLCNHCFD